MKSNEKENKPKETSFSRLKHHDYDWTNEYLRDSWYPFRNVPANNVVETVKKAKRI